MRGELHLLGRHDLVGDLPHHRADALAVGENVDAEACRRRLEGEVGVVDACVLLAVLGGRDRPQHRFQAGRAQDAVPAQRNDVAVEAQARVHVAGEVEVAGALLDHRVEEIAHRLRGVFRGRTNYHHPFARLRLGHPGGGLGRLGRGSSSRWRRRLRRRGLRPFLCRHDASRRLVALGLEADLHLARRGLVAELDRGSGEGLLHLARNQFADRADDLLGRERLAEDGTGTVVAVEIRSGAGLEEEEGSLLAEEQVDVRV